MAAIFDSDTFIQSVEIYDSTDSTSSVGCLMLYGGLTVYTTANAVSQTQGGGLTMLGGASISKDILLSGLLRNTNITESTNASNGGIFTLGGLGVTKNLNVNGIASIGNTSFVNTTSANILNTNLTTTNISSSTLLVASRNPASVASFRSVSASTSATVALIELQRDPSSGGDALYGDGSTSNVRCKSSIRLINRTFSTPKQNDAITFNADGTGVAFNLDLNYGFVSILDTRESTGITNGSMVVNGGMAVAKTIYSTNVNTTTFTSGTAFFTTGITSASALLTIATIPNLITTNVTTNTLNVTTGITSASAILTTATIPNLTTTNITTGVLNASGITTGPMTITYNSGGAQLYFQRADGTSIHTIKTNVDNSMMINAFGGGASMWLNADTSVFFGKLANTTGSTMSITSSTGANGLVVVNSPFRATTSPATISNLVSTNITSGNAFFTTGITSASALLTTATIPNLITTNVTSSTLNLTTGITAGTGRFTSITGGTGFFTTGITTGNLTVNTVDSTPTIGDIYKQVSFSGANSQAAAANVIGLTFTNANTRGFKVFVTVVVLATSSLYAFYELDGIQRGADWQMSSARTGDDPIVVFSITTSGQVQYTSSTYAGFTSLTFKFRALTIST